MNSFVELIQKCDADIKIGRAHDVSKSLAKLNTAQVPRESRLPLAKICRRAGLYSLGLKLLRGLIFLDSGKIEKEATSAELAEYAVLLQRSGALTEAMEKLARVKTDEVPDALLYRAFIHFARWDFNEAIPYLENYLAGDLTPYASLVGRVNLAFALVETRKHEPALGLLKESLRLIEKDPELRARSRQLESNCFALRGQIYLQEKNYSQARKEFGSARELFFSAQSNDQFFAEKWSLILDGLEKNDPRIFLDLREKALQARAWETIREADLFSLKVEFDQNRLEHLHFGSPFAGFRNRLSEEFDIAHLPPEFILGPKSAPCMDLSSGDIDGAIAFSSGRKSHQLIEGLLRDFYRPLRIGGIFSALFPGEPFDVNSSPHRIHQLMTRTRSWIKKHDLPIQIAESRGFYTIQCDGPFAFRIPRERDAVDLVQLQLKSLHAAFSHANAFSVQDVKQALSLSPATISRLLQRALREGLITRTGRSGRALIYSFVPQELSRKKTA